MIATAVPDLGHTPCTELLTYLTRRLEVVNLRWRQPLTVIPNGWETSTYRFQIESPRRLPEPFARPLILRAYSSRHGLARLRREFEVQSHMWRRGYPVPEPLLMEENCRPFGGPFMIMEWVPGETLLQFLLDHPMRIWRYPGLMAELQWWLNTMPVQDFPAPAGPHLPRSLKWLGQIVHECDLEGFAPGLEWLQAHQPDPPSRPCILHLDFHPLNLVIHEGRFDAVLDWSDADVGDYHADVATTLLLLDAAPIRLTKWRHWLVSLPGQGILRRRYLRAYRARLPIDNRKLRYYLAWAALRRLLMWARWLYAGPLATGIKPSTIRELTRRRLQFVADYFERHSGVAIHLPEPSRASRAREYFNRESNPAPA
jgi:aminoglycoside phosphotransferase (APT) family kinase protein